MGPFRTILDHTGPYRTIRCMICQSIPFRQDLWEWPFPQCLWEWCRDSSCSQNSCGNADLTPSLNTLAVLPIKCLMIINITFRRKPCEFTKIYAIGGGVDEGVEGMRVYQFVVLVHKMHLLQINYFSLMIWKWAKALKALMHPYCTLSEFRIHNPRKLRPVLPSLVPVGKFLWS